MAQCGKGCGGGFRFVPADAHSVVTLELHLLQLVNRSPASVNVQCYRELLDQLLTDESIFKKFLRAGLAQESKASSFMGSATCIGKKFAAKVGLKNKKRATRKRQLRSLIHEFYKDAYAVDIGSRMSPAEVDEQRLYLEGRRVLLQSIYEPQESGCEFNSKRLHYLKEDDIIQEIIAAYSRRIQEMEWRKGNSELRRTIMKSTWKAGIEALAQQAEELFQEIRRLQCYSQHEGRLIGELESLLNKVFAVKEHPYSDKEDRRHAEHLFKLINDNYSVLIRKMGSNS